MDPRDVILTALKPGTPLNPQDKEFRSLAVLAALTALTAEAVQDILVGDLAQQVHIKPSEKHTWMVRLKPAAVQEGAAALAAIVAAEQGDGVSADLEVVERVEISIGVDSDPGLCEKAEALAAESEDEDDLEEI